jgi:osmotically inducible lipoprotein OsmB
MRRCWVFAMSVLAALSLAGCGVTPGCRAVSTGAAGAATGAALGAIGGNAGLGALIGGLTGAVGGAATSPRAAYAGPSPVCY